MACSRINGQLTVNGGVIITTIIPCFVEAQTFEVLGPGYSTHRENMVCYYFSDEAGRKVMIGCTDEVMFIHKFKGPNDLQQYWSTGMPIWKALRRSKHRLELEKVLFGYETIFGRQVHRHAD